MSRPAYDASDIADSPMMRPIKYQSTRRRCHVEGCIVTGPHRSHRVVEIRQLAAARDEAWLTSVLAPTP